MLNALRKGAGTWIAKAFFFVLVISFAVWGIGDLGRVRPDNTAVTVGDVKISGTELNDAFQRDFRQLQANFGGGITQEQAIQLGLLQNTLQQLVSGALHQQAANELGLTSPDAAVREQIYNNRAFFNELGQFDPNRFQAVLRQNGFTEADFVALSRREHARDQLFSSVTTGADVPDSLVKALYRHEQERRVAELLTIPNASVENVPAPTDAQLTKYYEGHEEQFTAPEYRALTYATLTPEDLQAEVAVSEEELRTAYESRIDEFSVPEVRQIEQVLFQDEAIAEAAAQRLAQGGDFYAVASEVAGMDEATVKLGALRKDQLPLEPALADAVFALPEGGVSEPLRSALGWHLFRVTEVQPGRQPSFEELRDELAADLRLERAAEAIFDIANNIEDELAGGASLEEVAQSFNLRSGQVEAVDASGRNPAGESVEGLPEAAEFLDTAFDTEPGEEPFLHETDAGGYFLVRVDSVIEPRLRPLEEVRDEVAAAWTAETRTAMAAERAKVLAERVRNGTELSSVAAEAGGEIRRTEALTRDTFGRQTGVSQDVVKALFEAETGAVVTGATQTGDGQVVARLAEVQQADPDADQGGVSRVADNVAGSIRNDLWTQFRNALEQNYEVEVNDRVVQSLFVNDAQ